MICENNREMESQRDQPVQSTDSAERDRSVHFRVSVEVHGGAGSRPLKIEAQVEGEGELAQQVAAQLSNVIAAAIAQVSSAALSPNAKAGTQVGGATIEATSSAPTNMPETLSLNWIQRNRTRVSLGFGGLLLALAVLAPIIAPPGQRSDVLIMTLLFGLTGALMLFTSMLPARSAARGVTPASATSASAAPAVTTARISTSRRASLLRYSQPRTMKTGWGIAMGLIFVIAGILAPFTLGAVTADERFIIMIGFAPIAIVGLFMIFIFGRGALGKLRTPIYGGDASRPNASRPKPAAPPSASTSASAPKRTPVTRVPKRFDYQVLVPVAIGALLVLLVVVVSVVIFATIAPFAR